MPVELNRVILNNGLNYRVLDTLRGVWTDEQCHLPSFDSWCTMKLPVGPYSSLQWTIGSTQHTQNEVLAQQSSCSAGLTLHEFIAYGSLRAGERLQWYNIIRELGSSDLDLNADAVGILLTQAAWQAGSPLSDSEFLRESHAVFGGETFCRRMHEVLLRTVHKIEANWKELNSMNILIILSLRLLSLNRNKFIAEQVLQLLSKIRQVTLQWTKDIAQNMHDNQDQLGDSSRSQERLLKAALMCRMTFDVDSQYVSSVLQTSTDIAIFVECSIRAHDSSPDDVSQLPLPLQCALLRDHRLAHFMEPRMARLIRECNSGFTEGILRIWQGVHLPNNWSFMQAPLERWVVTRTVSSGGSLSQTVHYDILSGKLLVDGRRLGRIPAEYARHELYKRIFRSTVLEVVAADEIGMSYRTTRLIHDYRVYFGVVDGSFLIRIKNKACHLEAIPSEIFRGDLPANFVSECIHWLNLDTGEIEFRPLTELWLSNPEHWQLSFKQEPQLIYQGQKSLIDPRSSTCAQINEILKPIESKEFIHVISSGESHFEIELPRLRLRFVVNETGWLECPELGTVVDEDQSIGTFYGLKNRLLMRDFKKLSKARRSLLVPYGTIVTEWSGDTTHVHIDTGSSGVIRYFSFQLDQRLQQIRSGSDVAAHFYKVYLHAVTSNLLPDCFTGRTGLEEAVSCLLETGAWTCAPLPHDIVNLLNMIAKLTPERTFYPSHLKCMQKTQWNPGLNPLVQHTKFYMLAKNILEHSNRFVGLYEGEVARALVLRGSDFLQERASYWNSAFYVYSLQDTMIAEAKDHDYKSRDRDPNSAAAERSFEISGLIKDWPSRLKVEDDLYSQLAKKWPTVDGFGQPFLSTSISELLILPLWRYWGSLYSHCCCSSSNDAFGLTFLFCTISYSEGTSTLELRSLLALAFVDFTRLPKKPASGAYVLSEGYELRRSMILEILDECEYGYENAISGVPADVEEQRELDVYQREVREQGKNVLDKIVQQWPQAEPPTLMQSDASRIDVKAVVRAVGKLFKRWFRNYELFGHFEEIKPILREMDGPEPLVPAAGDFRLDWKPFACATRVNPIPSLDKLLEYVCCPALSCKESLQLPAINDSAQKREVEFTELQDIISECSSRGDAIRLQYGTELFASLEALKMTKVASHEFEVSCSLDALAINLHKAEQLENDSFQEIFDKLQPKIEEPGEVLLLKSGLWPRVTPRELLLRLSQVHHPPLRGPWKQALLAYGEILTDHQRAVRLLAFAECGNTLALCKELNNRKCDGWSPDEYPDWRLMEIENDFLIRPIQARVAKKMIAPTSGNNNSVMQLNMGEGKSSVIIPMLASALANGRKLARCIVLKPLAKQMEHLLSQRLGGLIGRRVYYAPFSRKTLLTSEIAGRLDEIYRECKDAQGVLLIQPEHILSFKLMGIERLSSKDLSLAVPMINTQTWLEKNSRDLLDESDELLHVNFELAYTIGSQIILDGQPARWIVAQSLFSLIDERSLSLSKQFPKGIERVPRGQGSFPMFRILEPAFGVRLMAELTTDIMNGYVPGLSFDHCSKAVRDAVSEFITDLAASPNAVQHVMQNFQDTVQLQTIYLLRGLIGHGILSFALQRKRWLVNYGLDLRRCLMAVPYRAKSIPSVSAEFAHPDVAILLTCLSYYYTGLNNDQLRTSFALLGKMTDPSFEYDRWHQNTMLPGELRNFSGVNLDDNNQWKDSLYPCLRLNKGVIDFFLSRVVFPKEGKEFLHKLSTSAWDLPVDCAYSMTTGFSGTNDNRLLLPLNIHQQDLAELKYTSAMVLKTLLRKENREYVLASDVAGQRLSVEQLLQLLIANRRPIRVLLDVGAQVLEVSNRQVIEKWLQLALDVKAGVFFDDNDELMVLDREGKFEPLFASSFRERLGECVIYLDEAHTRGTDLAFPLNYRAAVTLGPELTKDRFVQGRSNLPLPLCLIALRPKSDNLKQPVCGCGTLDMANLLSVLPRQRCTGTFLISLKSLNRKSTTQMSSAGL